MADSSPNTTSSPMTIPKKDAISDFALQNSATDCGFLYVNIQYM